MSTSANDGMFASLSGAKKFSACVRSGILEVRAKPFSPTSALMRLDLPTLERPAKATSGGPWTGSAARFGAESTKRQGIAKRRRVSSAESVRWLGIARAGSDAPAGAADL